MAIEVVVVGAGGFGRETLDVIEAINHVGAEQFSVLGVADDAPSDANVGRLQRRGYRLLGSVAEVLAGGHTERYALAVGNPQARALVARKFDVRGWSPVTLVHPDAVVGSAGSVGEGAIICGGVQVSTNVQLGRHVHLNPNCTIGHDADLADFVSVNPGAIVSGEVRIEPEVLIGAGAVLLQGLHVGSASTVGACACVTRDVPSRVVAKGVPARWD